MTPQEQLEPTPAVATDRDWLGTPSGPVTVTGQRIQYLRAVGATLEEAVRAYTEQNPGCVPDGWETDTDEGEIVGLCESCGLPILPHEECGADPDGVLVCVRCYPTPEEMAAVEAEIAALEATAPKEADDGLPF